MKDKKSQKRYCYYPDRDCTHYYNDSWIYWTACFLNCKYNQVYEECSNSEHNAAQETHEKSIISLTYAIIHKRTMMIEHFNAILTCWTMTCSWRSVDFTDITKFSMLISSLHYYPCKIYLVFLCLSLKKRSTWYDPRVSALSQVKK